MFNLIKLIFQFGKYIFKYDCVLQFIYDKCIYIQNSNILLINVLI